ncbi:protein NRT1/ PTR FAMILY 5.10-like [Lycium ferocissimum]|uniref:protein NRT1/ PTR FAMILY 5.10-like n=1 Tax=Lycium ferocissimum TaxID=112874 RepID=UPI002815673B|nr:protein NRT1/ PTR FAMILY 5.10-like [Lycium ferocissimum]
MVISEEEEAAAASRPSNDVVPGCVDYYGHPVQRSKSGRWRSASLIICVEMAERFAYYGINSNLINYLTGPLGQSTAAAAENVNAWSGTAALTPLLGALVADSFLGRYRTVVFASLLYILGLGLLTLSAVLPLFISSNCQTTDNGNACSPPQLQVILFFFSLYLVAIAQGGHKPCVQAFGADQFDPLDPKECKARSSFFNWWYFGMCGGNIATVSVLNYIQDNFNWGLGFGIPCIAMGLALVIFWLGTLTYRFSSISVEQSPFVRIGMGFLKTVRNLRATSVEETRVQCHQNSQQFEGLNNALLSPDDHSAEDGQISNTNDTEEEKGLVRLVPVWGSCLIYAIVFAQAFTLFTKQGVTMDRSITPSFKIPSAALQSFINLSVIIFIPIYEQILVPITRTLTGTACGITKLQRVGTGIFLSVLTMAIAALVEMKRLEIAREYGLVDVPNATVPMTIWWLVPQYLLFGITEVFTMVGLQEFFYDQVPREFRSIGLSLYLSIFGVGSFLSSFLIFVIEKTTGGDRDGWISNNLNRGHLDYFYWLLSGLSALGFITYLYFARHYVYAHYGKVI